MRQRISVGISRIGGIGDTIFLSAFAKAVKMKYFPCEITVFVRKDSLDVLTRDPNIDHILLGPMTAKELEPIGKKFEIFFDCRYATRTYFNNPAFDDGANEILFRKYHLLWKGFTASNRFLLDYGINTFALPFITTNLNASPDDLFIWRKEYPLDLEDKSFVALHTDSSQAPTKGWFADYWQEVINWLSEHKIPTVLVGLLTKDKYKNVSLDLRGKTDVHQVADVIAKAKLLIGPESGLVHIARAVKTQSVVLFGPTPPSLFGYSDNINIQVGTCRNCFCGGSFWFLSCWKYAYPKCMREIRPELVISYLNSLFFGVNEPIGLKSGEDLVKEGKIKVK